MFLSEHLYLCQIYSCHKHLCTRSLKIKLIWNSISILEWKGTFLFFIWEKKDYVGKMLDENKVKCLMIPSLYTVFPLPHHYKHILCIARINLQEGLPLWIIYWNYILLCVPISIIIQQRVYSYVDAIIDY